MQRKLYSSGTKWEPIVGYSRALRVGPLIFISRTTATTDSGEIVGINDPYAQTVQILRNIEKALHGVDSKLEDVARTRIFVTTIDDWEQVGRAHGVVFASIRPATSMIEVSRFIDKRMLVEIEAEAFSPEADFQERLRT